jgi:hypothetical protein
MNIKSLLFFLFLLAAVAVKAQDWQPGCYYDTTGVKHPAYIQITTMDNGARYGSSKIIGSEVFKIAVDAKARPQEMYAFDVKAIVAGLDSFVVKKLFRTNRKGVVKRDTNGNPYQYAEFYKVELDHSETKIYSKEKAGNNTFTNYVDYYYGTSVNNMEWLTNDNFIEAMSKIMKDSPDLVVKIQSEKFKLRRINKLIEAYKTEKGIPFSKEDE